MPADTSATAESHHRGPEDIKTNPSKSSISINLTGKPKESNSSMFYKWTIHIGRIVIVLTELVALSALGYRFVIDRQITDLNDQIEKQVLFIRNLQEREDTFRAVQNKIETITTIKEATDAKVSVMNKVLGAANTNVFSTNGLNVQKNIISVDGTTSSVFALNNFIENIKQDQNIQTITIEDITSTDAGVLFKMTILLRDSMPEEE
jgi:hypothetical protein